MATHLWKGGSGNWTDPAQWLPNGAGVPQTGDAAVVASGTVAFAGVSLASETVTISGASAVAVNSTGLTLDAASTLTVTNTANPQIRLDKTTVNAGSIDIAAPSFLYVGYYGIGARFTQSGTLQFDAPSYVYFQSNNNTLANSGLLTISSGGGLQFYDNGSGNLIVNTGTIFVGSSSQATVIDASISGSGEIDIGANAALDVRAVGGGSVLFKTRTGHLALDGSDLTGNLMTATIGGFSTGDTIDLGTNLVDTVSYDSNAQLLTTSYGGITTGTLAIAGQYATADFTIDTTGPTVLLTTDVFSPGVACFAQGTRILTARGQVAVEDLRPGDLVPTALPQSCRSVVWIGHRTIDCRRHPRVSEVMPIRVAAGAFGPGRPMRDLRLSPDHAVHVAGRLIPIRYLVNAATIVVEPVLRVTYWHVELDAHDVLLAEGLPCESYLDTGNRGAFANGGPAIVAHPDFSRAVWHARSCAPLALEGEPVTAARTMLLHRAEAMGHALTDEPEVTLLACGAAPGNAALHPRRAGRLLRFVVPPASSALVLRSRASVPAHVDPASDDTRRLGIGVAGLRIDGVDVPPGDRRLGCGWHVPEPEWQWTNGQARIEIAGAHMVELLVATTRRYWREATTAAAVWHRVA